mgnify:CR=1 FL=1
MEQKELEELITKHCGDDYTVNVEELVIEVAKLSHNNAIRLASEITKSYYHNLETDEILKLLKP